MTVRPGLRGVVARDIWVEVARLASDRLWPCRVTKQPSCDLCRRLLWHRLAEENEALQQAWPMVVYDKIILSPVTN